MVSRWVAMADARAVVIPARRAAKTQGQTWGGLAPGSCHGLPDFVFPDLVLPDLVAGPDELRAILPPLCAAGCCHPQSREVNRLCG